MAFKLLGLMVLLAGLDFGGTMLAKEWTVHRQHWLLVAGGAMFLALFAVLVASLKYAEMSVLVIGWIVVLQVGVVLIDRSRYGLSVAPGGWAAMAAILLLQGYLVLGASRVG